MSLAKLLGLDAIKGLIGVVTDWLEAKAERKRIEIASETRIRELETEARTRIATSQVETAAELAKAEQAHEINWDILQAESSKKSWRDEVMMIAILWPYIGAFIPGMRSHVQDGFATLETLPDWYIISFGTTVAAAFGYRAVVKHFLRPKRAVTTSALPPVR